MSRRQLFDCDHCGAPIAEAPPVCEVSMTTSGGPLPAALWHVRVVKDLCPPCIEAVRSAIVTALDKKPETKPCAPTT